MPTSQPSPPAGPCPLRNAAGEVVVSPVLVLEEDEAELVGHLFWHTYIPERFFAAARSLGRKLDRRT